jgi:uncharacterized delta-60 repeat protein
MNLRRLAPLAALLALLLVPAAIAAGELDPSFDGDGRVVTDVPGSYEGAYAVATQADGKIVTAGEIIAGAARDFAVNRYTSDGRLDASFGGDGSVTTDFDGDFDAVYAVLIQPDGKVLVAGQVFIGAVFTGHTDFGLARYNLDGSLDTSFGGDGKVTTDLAGSYDAGYGLAIQPDGKIVVAGRADGTGRPTSFGLARYHPDGTLDTSFDGDGKVITDFAGAHDRAYDVAVQGDGKIVAVGETTDGGSVNLALARYGPNGSLDTTFGGDGRVVTDFGGSDLAAGVALQPDGKIVAAGRTGGGSSSDFALARYGPDGDLDASFGGDGKVVTDFAGNLDGTSDLAVQNDGKIVAAGWTLAGAGGPPDFALTRYTSDGGLDVSFDGDGRVVTDFGSGDSAHGVALQTDGKIVAAGSSGDTYTDSYNVVLARYLPADTTAPTINSVMLSANPVPVGATSTLQVTASDDSGVTGGEYTIDGGSPRPLSATLSATVSGLATGVYTLEARVRDAAGNWSAPASVILAVYDPSGGFVTGAGTIDSPAGAYAANPALAGGAKFGFVSQYRKGADTPTGKTDFEFRLADFEFESTSYQWLVVAGAKAQYKGLGTVNGTGAYGFLLTATDGDLSGGGGIDKFRIKIWDMASGAVVYDNGAGASDDMDQANPQAIVSGSIVVHK